MRGVTMVVLLCGLLGSQAAAAWAESGVSAGFGDAGGVHAYGIEQMAHLGIDAGCGNGRFCPEEPIGRAEMATWLNRAAALINGTPHPPPAGEAPPEFSDASDEAITRTDAAMMLIAAFEHLAAVDEIEGIFADTGEIPEAAVKAVEGIHAAGLTKGCATGPLRYCPHRPITRGQAAAMLTRAIQRAEPTVGLILNEPRAARGYTLIYRYDSSAPVYLIDHLGRIVHTWELRGRAPLVVKLLENGNLMVVLIKQDSGRWVAEVARSGDIVWEYHADVHHDFFKLPNGNVLLLMSEMMTSQEAIASGARLDPLMGRRWWYDYVQEVKPTGPNGGEVVWEWSVLDHLVQDHDPGKPDYGPIAGNPGRIDINYSIHQIPLDRYFTHINAIDYDPVLDQIMLSVRAYSELWIIDHNTTTAEAAGAKGDLLYRWGNPRAYGAGDYQDQQLFWQHNAHWIPPGLPGAGNVLILNNGSEFVGYQRGYSSVDEIALPALSDNAYPREPDHGFEPAQMQWSYTAPNPDDFYAHHGSGTQRLPNGNTQICDVSGTVFQVTPDGTTVWKYINPTQESNRPPTYQGDHIRTHTYRAPWYPPDYPGLKNLDLTPKGHIEQYR